MIKEIKIQNSLICLPGIYEFSCSASFPKDLSLCFSYLSFVLRNYFAHFTPVSGDLVSFLWRYFYLMSPGKCLCMFSLVRSQKRLPALPSLEEVGCGGIWLGNAVLGFFGLCWFLGFPFTLPCSFL